MTKQSLLLRLDNAIKELDEIRADLRAAAQAAESNELGAQCDEELPPRDYLSAYEEYAATQDEKPGDVQIRGQWYNAVDGDSCDGCAFFPGGLVCLRNTTDYCSSIMREDGRSIIFVKVQ